MSPAAPRSRPPRGATKDLWQPATTDPTFQAQCRTRLRREGVALKVSAEEATMNHLRTAILLAGLTALFMGVGYLIGGGSGAVIALIIAAAMNLASYWNADKLVLAMHDAHEVDESTAPDLVHLVQDLARRAGLPMPRVYLMDNPQPNAFATGRNPEHAAGAATTGLLQRLSPEEVAGVLAQMAISRTREYAADELGARISGRPDALASALAKISATAEAVVNPTAERAPATAHLFIVNPLTGHGMDNLFSTHPSTEI